MATRRQQRLNQVLREEIAKLLRHETEDPQLGSLISITEVDVAPDLQRAKVYVSVLAEEEAARETLQRLRRAARFFRRELAERLNLRHTPQLDFELDTSIARGDRVLRLLRDIGTRTGAED
jgi:ribosome-binding factor A